MEPQIRNVLVDALSLSAGQMGVRAMFVELVRALADRSELRLTLLCNDDSSQIFSALAGHPRVTIRISRVSAPFGLRRAVAQYLLLPVIARRYACVLTASSLPVVTVGTPVVAVFVSQILLPSVRRDLGRDGIRPPLKRRISLGVRWRIVRRALRATGHVIAISEDMAGRLACDADLKRERITVAYPSSPLGSVPEGARRVDGSFLVVGTLVPHKNHELAIRALATLKRRHSADATLEIIGLDINGDGWERLRAVAAHLEMTDSVHYHGVVGDDEVARAYARSCALIVPSLSEGFGLTVLEAFRSGCPVIAVSRGALPEIVDGAGLVVEPRSDALADAMLQVLREDGLAASLADMGRKRAERFCWQNMAATVSTAIAREVGSVEER